MKYKYYVEIVDNSDICCYVTQSKIFNTIKEADNWVKTIDFLDENFSMYLMRGECEEDNCLTEIETIKKY